MKTKTKEKEGAPEREPVLKELTEETVDVVESEVESTGEFAVNEDKIQMAEGKEPKEEEVLPSYFVEEDETHDVEIDILYNPSDGKVVSISRVGMDIDFDDFTALRHKVERFVFSVPDYDDIAGYKQRAVRQTMVGVQPDKTQFRNFLIVWHLKDWTLCDKKGEKIELVTDEENDKRLSDESISQVMSISPSLLDTVLSIFEKDMLLT